MRRRDLHDVVTRVPPRRRPVTAGLVALMLSATALPGAAQPGAAPGWTGPDLSLYVSSEEAVVVSIRTSTSQRDRTEERDCPAGLDDDGETRWPGSAACGRKAAERTLASGFVISSDGYILTNAHVVADVDGASVQLADRRQYEARIVGFDRRTDIALLKIDASGLVPARLADASRLAVGEWVIAIGAPFGLESTLTAGIVSARRRYLREEDGIPWIQTDAAMNPGSSGGPLFNLRGEVIGVNSMIYSESGSYAGVSFALPIDLAMQVAGELRERGYVLRAQLGTQVQEVTPELARSFGLADAKGALVVRVRAGSPSESAGVRVGDIVLGIDGIVDASYGEVQQAVLDARPGIALSLNLWRRGAVQRVSITPVASPPEARSTREPTVGPIDRLHGLVIGKLDDARRMALNIRLGVAVESASGRASRAGIRAGDVILAVNDISVGSVAEFDAAIKSVAPNRPAALLVQRGLTLAYLVLDRLEPAIAPR